MRLSGHRPTIRNRTRAVLALLGVLALCCVDPPAFASTLVPPSQDAFYTYSGTTLGAVTLNGAPLVDTQTYRVVTNNFLQGGGDNFPTMAKGTNVYYGGLDIDAFANYLEKNSPYTPGSLDRITKN